jgi:hypothetical protein
MMIFRRILFVVNRLISVKGHFFLDDALLGEAPFGHRYKAYQEKSDDQRGI